MTVTGHRSLTQTGARAHRGIFGRTDRVGAALWDPPWVSRSIFVVGGLLTFLGLIMIPLPGPGELVVTLGLQVLTVGLVVSATTWLWRQRRKPTAR